MITKFTTYINENVNESGIFSVNLNNQTLVFKLRFSTEILIILEDDIYQELSITIPDSKNLNDTEFYLNPSVDEKIVDVLVNENFIEKLDKESIAGEQKTYLYTLI